MSAEGVAVDGGTAVNAALAFAESSPEITRSRTLVWQDPVPTAAAGATMTGMEYMEAIVAGAMPPPPIAVTMRMRPIELGEGKAVFEGEPGEEHYNPIGVVHGGYAATLLDSALGCAVHTMMPVGRGYTTAELSVNFVRGLGPTVGRVRAEGKVIHCGRQLATAEARLVGADGTLYAHATTTCLVFERPPAR